MNSTSQELLIEEEEHVNNIKDFYITVEKGDSVIDILKRYKINKNDIYNLLSSLKEKYNIRKIYEGQKINFTIEYGTEKVNLINFEIDIDQTRKLVSIHNDDGIFESKIIKNTKFKKIVKVSQSIKGSLFSTGTAIGLSDQLIMNLAYLYGTNINLNRDISDGSKFEVIFEKFVDEKGGFSHYGNIIYASLTSNKNKKFEIYHYISESGISGYFYGDGGCASNKQQLLSLPLKEMKISSPFGERYHPISKKISFHKGVDLIASVGTPVKTSGSGIVEYIGNRGGYGKYVKIKHDKNYSTAYAHLSKFREGLKVGSTVKAGETIAYSGKTGNVTGPHLHYEVLYNNKQIDPMRKSMKVLHLGGEELIKFKRFIYKIQNLEDQSEITDFL